MARLVAVVFRDREKDYGGVHVGVDAGAIAKLRTMVADVRRTAQGVALVPPPTEFAWGIVRGHRPRPVRRLELVAADATRIVIGAHSATIELSETGADALRGVLDRLDHGEGDLVLPGDSDGWTDRAWWWPL